MRIIITIAICALACAQQMPNPTTPGAGQLDGYSTVRSIKWGAVPYDRSAYESDEWTRTRREICNAPTLFYTGESNNACEADHVMSVSEAHHRGAHRWTQLRKRTFYTDDANLVASRPDVNRSKSNHTPAQVSTSAGHGWDVPGADCEYVTIWISTLTRYGLDITRAERDNAAAFIARCETGDHAP